MSKTRKIKATNTKGTFQLTSPKNLKKPWQKNKPKGIQKSTRQYIEA